MVIINLTPHTITIVGQDGKILRSFPPSGNIARVSTIQKDAGTIAGVPVKLQTYGAVQGLPAPQDGVVYIVSSIVAQAADGRDDLIIPDTANAIRDDQGRIIGVPGFIKLG